MSGTGMSQDRRGQGEEWHVQRFNAIQEMKMWRSHTLGCRMEAGQRGLKSFIHTAVGQTMLQALQGAAEGAVGGTDPTHGPSKSDGGNKQVGSNSVSASVGVYTRAQQSASMLLGPLKVRALQTRSESRNLVTVLEGSWKRCMWVEVTVT